MKRLILALSLIAIAVGFAPTAHAEFLNKHYCNEVPLCWYVNPNNNDFAYGETYATSNNQLMTTANVDVCLTNAGVPTDQVQYDTSTNNFCPFTRHNMDSNYKGDTIITITAGVLPTGWCFANNGTDMQYQANQCTGTGLDNVLDHGGFSGDYNLVNVYQTDQTTGGAQCASSHGDGTRLIANTCDSSADNQNWHSE